MASTQMRSLRLSRCLGLVAIAVCSNQLVMPLATFASSPPPAKSVQPQTAHGISERLNRAENCILGQTHREKSLVDRLSALEEQLFGEPSAGPAVARMAAIEEILAGKNDGKTVASSLRNVKNAPAKAAKSQVGRTAVANKPRRNDLPPIKISRSDFLPPIAPTLDLSARPAQNQVSTAATSAPSTVTSDKQASAGAPQTALAAQTVATDTKSGDKEATNPSPSPEPLASASADSKNTGEKETDSTAAKDDSVKPKNETAMRGDDSDPKIRELLRKGLKAHADGNDAEAEKLFKQVLVKSPFNSTAFYNLGVLAERKGDLPGALGSYRTALVSHPEDTELQAAVAQVEDAIVRKQGGNLSNPVVYKDGRQTILRGNASDFGVNAYANGYGGAPMAGANAPMTAPYYPPYNGQVNGTGGFVPPPMVNVAQQPTRRPMAGKVGAAAAEFAGVLAISATRAAINGGGAFGPSTFVNALHCPICRLLH